MKLRPRQEDFVRKLCYALAERGNTLGVAPTGAGKTVMLSAAVKQQRVSSSKLKAGIPYRALVIQHRDELVAQNRSTYKRVDPETPTDVYAADRKRWSEGVTFAMVQTLAREDNLETMPAMDLVVIDEAHHVAAESYIKIINKVRELNPNVRILGVTATPQRADKRALIEVFDNVADVISIKELIEAGNLVRPRVFVIDCGLRGELANVRRTVSDFDMAEVEAIMDKQAVTEKVIAEWQATAGSRKTVAFCSTVAHAQHVCEAFEKAGIRTGIVHGGLSDGARRKALHDFETDKTQFLVNVAVLTEGYDCQTVSCVMLLRPCSYKSTMIQMIGRGLRRVDPERHPGVVKSDCIVLDFGYSMLTHGGLDTDVVLEPIKGEARTKPCPGCQMNVPLGVSICPTCDYIFDNVERRRSEMEERDQLKDFQLTEVEIFELSPFKWELFWDGAVTIANAMSAWACVVQHSGRQYSVGGKEGDAKATLISVTDDRLQAIAAADDYLREHGDKDASRKSKRWLHEAPSQRQLDLLGLDMMSSIGMSKYRATCELTWKWREKLIRAKVLSI